MEEKAKTTGNSKRINNRRLMRDTVIGLVLVFVLFLIINRIISSYLANKQFYDYLDVHLLDSSTYTRAILYEYDKTLPWLISYWSEHSDEMDIPRDASAADDHLNKILSELNEGKDIFSYSTKDLQSMSDEDRKKYAEACYLMIADKFDNLANTYGNMNFFCTRAYDDSNSEMILFMGMNDKNTAPYLLGTLYEVEKVEKRPSYEFIEHEEGSSYYVTSSTEVIPETLDALLDDQKVASGRESYSYYIMKNVSH